MYHFAEAEISPEAKQMATLNAERRGTEVLSMLAAWLDRTPGSVLDVGGRNGELMGAFIRRGYQVNVLDMEAGEPVFPSIRKIRLPFLRWDGGRYDLITMLHVLEHTSTPSRFLCHAHSLLKEQGLLYVEVPSELLTPLLFRRVGDYRHIGYFSRQTLRRYIEGAGFECLSCRLCLGFVGSRLPVVRAIGRKVTAARAEKSLHMGSRGKVIGTVAEAFHPMPVLVRLMNRLGF